MEVNFSIKFELFASKISFILESKELNFSSNKDVVLSKPSPSLFVNSSIEEFKTFERLEISSILELNERKSFLICSEFSKISEILLVVVLIKFILASEFSFAFIICANFETISFAWSSLFSVIKDVIASVSCFR